MNPGTNIGQLAVAVTFFYGESRFAYLSQIAAQFDSLADRVNVYVVTNAADAKSHEAIRRALSGHKFNLKILSPALLGHPYLLAWCHFDVFRRLLATEPAISHFMYLEDDTLITRENIAYWLEGREALRSSGLIPSFLRYETKDGDDKRFSTDITSKSGFEGLPKVEISNSYAYINFPEPYQGMYLLDRELMVEHMAGVSSHPDFGDWKIREKAAQGLTFAGVADGCYSRNFVGFDRDKMAVDGRCLIHHLPNNYASDPKATFGKIPVADLVF